MKNPNRNGATKPLVFAMAGCIAAFAATQAFAAEDILESAQASCQKDIDTYCKDVTRGEGRILECLSAHQDKISNRCTYALDDASLQVERVALAVKYLGVECKDDLMKHCADIPIGDGRVASCLKKNDATLAAGCKQAIKDTRVDVK